MLEVNQKHLDYKTSRPNPGAYHPFIVIKSDNYEKFNSLNAILSQLDTDLSKQPDVIIVLSKDHPLYLNLKIGSKSFDIERSLSESLTERIILIRSLI